METRRDILLIVKKSSTRFGGAGDNNSDFSTVDHIFAFYLSCLLLLLSVI